MHPYIPNLVFTVLLFFVPIWDYFYQDGDPSVSLLPVLPAVILLSLNNGVKYDIIPQTKAAAVILLLTLTAVCYALYSHSMSEGAWKWEYAALMVLGTAVFLLLLRHIKKLSTKETKRSALGKV